MYCVCRGYTERLQRELIADKARVDRLLLRLEGCNLYSIRAFLLQYCVVVPYVVLPNPRVWPRIDQKWARKALNRLCRFTRKAQGMLTGIDILIGYSSKELTQWLLVRQLVVASANAKIKVEICMIQNTISLTTKLHTVIDHAT